MNDRRRAEDDDLMPSDPTSDEKTPPRGLTDSERQRFLKQYASGVPVVQGIKPPWDPSEIFSEDLDDAELELWHQLRGTGGDQHRVTKILVKLIWRLKRKLDDDQSGNEQMLGELRTLLDRPPNGRVAKIDERVKKIEETHAGAKRAGIKIGLAVIGTLVGSATAIVATVQSSAERKGRQDEQIHQLQGGVAEIKALIAPLFRPFPGWQLPPSKDKDKDP